MQKIIDRVKGILLKPNETWDEVKAEQTDGPEIIREFVIYVAAVPAVAGFLGSLFSGANFFTSLIWAILFYIFSILGVWASAKVLMFLAPNFKSEGNDVQFLKLTSVSFTPIFLACLFFLIPPFYGLSIVGIYGFYVFWIGFPKLVDCAEEEKFNFAVISVVVIAIMLLIIFTLSALLSGTSVTYLRI